jgi:hypothetical protein
MSDIKAGDLESRLLPCKVYTVVGDDMTWPSFHSELIETGWRLRYSVNHQSTGDLLVAASVIDAYLALIGKSQSDRNRICKSLKKATEKPKDVETHSKDLIPNKKETIGEMA